MVFHGISAKVISKRPKGFVPGQVLRNIDIREFYEFNIPPYKNKYYFDFIIFALDPTTKEYWITNYITKKICLDLRYYLLKKRKKYYKKIGNILAKKYNRTFSLGHINLRSGKLKQSKGINRLINHGWIPSFALFPQPYVEMVNIIEQSNDIDRIDLLILDFFKDEELDTLYNRWTVASITRGRERILETAINRIKTGDYISPIYILITQIEGLITKHIYRKQENPARKIEQRFKQFGDIIINEEYNTWMTKYLTRKLVSYLSNKYFKIWYPHTRSRMSSLAPQRHVLSHGSFIPEYFSKLNCLKLVTIIDAIILLSLNKRELKLHYK